MSALDGTPPNNNFLSPLGFKLVVRKLPMVVFWCQQAPIPSVSCPETHMGTPFTELQVQGDHITYDPLNITFKLDEDMTNYISLFNWMQGYAFPHEFQEYADIAAPGLQLQGQGLYSDMSLVILSNLKNPNVEFIFRDAFPTALSTLPFDTTDEDVMNVTCTATFRYTLFDIKPIPSGA